MSYCNRGDARVVRKGRWDIPDAIQEVMTGTGRPVLTDVRFMFAEGSDCDAYPVLVSNLYSDRPLVLFGRYPKGTSDIAFRAAGRAGDAVCDMIFSLSLESDAGQGDKDIRQEWGRQKIYHLIGQYTRTPDPSILREIRKTAKAYRIRVPYRGSF